MLDTAVREKEVNQVLVIYVEIVMKAFFLRTRYLTMSQIH